MYLQIRSRNLSANKLRRKIEVDKPTVYRLGSFTPNEEIFGDKYPNDEIAEINTKESCEKSNNKYSMKLAFDEWNKNHEDKIPTAKWLPIELFKEFAGDFKFPVIIKHFNSSKGIGIYYCETIDDFNKISEGLSNNHIVEEYKTYSREYRLHVDKFGCFLTNRKMLKNDATERWHRHHINTIWINEDNPMFDKPTNWDEIVKACQNAIESIGLSIGCVDVKVQNNKHENPKFIILETNSAPALGDATAELYIKELNKLIRQ